MMTDMDRSDIQERMVWILALTIGIIIDDDDALGFIAKNNLRIYGSRCRAVSTSPIRGQQHRRQHPIQSPFSAMLRHVKYLPF